MTRRKVPKKKLEIVFDAKKRKEFLTGFQKRKNERRKKAKEELERNLKDERKRIRQEIKGSIKYMKKSYEPLKELTPSDKTNDKEYEDNDVKVKIIELSTNDLAAQQNNLGDNFVQNSENEESSNDEECEVSANCIPGMDFDVNNSNKRKVIENEKINEIVCKKTETGIIKSKKELDQFKKTSSKKKINKSKVFKMKERLDKTVNQKQARKNRNNTLRSLPKHLRKKKNLEKSTYSKGRKMNKKQIKTKFEN